MLSVSFLVDSLKKQYGGVAANVAYNLTLHDEKPALLAAVGQDFDEYRAFMDERGIDTSAVRVVDGEFTASAFITSDKDNNQIAGFYPGAMREASGLSLDDTKGTADLVVITPDAPEAMARYPGQCRDRGIPYVFSPGQQIVSLTPEQLMDGVKGARCLIGNDYEMELIASKTGTTMDDLLDLADVVITTYGEQGSAISDGGTRVEIPAASTSEVVDPTGAGDAYLAGVALGLLRGEAPERYGRIASLTAAHAVEHYGTQRHTFDADGFAKRYAETFGQTL